MSAFSVRSFFVLSLLFSALLSGCNRRTTQGLLPRSFEHQGRLRTFHVFVPQTPRQTNPPLVVALHGGGGSGNTLDVHVGGLLTRAAQRRGWIIVFPEGISHGWNDGRPLVARRDRERADVDDVGFLASVMDRVASEFSIDRNRVYLTGISNGGFMTQRFAIDRSELLAAAASVTATVPAHLLSARPASAVPMLFVNGTDDPIVPDQGGQVEVFGQQRGLVASTQQSIAWWRSANGCAETAENNTLPDVDSSDGTRIVHSQWSQCTSRAPVELLHVLGGGHSWPGGNQYLPQRIIGRVSRDLDGAEAIFAFFARHRREH